MIEIAVTTGTARRTMRDLEQAHAWVRYYAIDLKAPGGCSAMAKHVINNRIVVTWPCTRAPKVNGVCYQHAPGWKQTPRGPDGTSVWDSR